MTPAERKKEKIERDMLRVAELAIERKHRAEMQRARRLARREQKKCELG